jgi:hypothetical protein
MEARFAKDLPYLLFKKEKLGKKTNPKRHWTKR